MYACRILIAFNLIQMMMAQNRVSPASSPMRRPSGSGSIGSPSPMAERPQSVENPLTPRNAGSSRPHTPSGSINCSPMEQQHLHQQHMNSTDNQHYSPMESCGIGNMGSPSSHKMHNFMPNPGDYQGQMNTDYANSVNHVNSGGGSGGGNSHVIPFPTFSFFDGPVKLGLKGGNPFSVVTEHTPSTSNANVEQSTTSNEAPTIVQVVSATTETSRVAHPAGGGSTTSTGTESHQPANFQQDVTHNQAVTVTKPDGIQQQVSIQKMEPICATSNPVSVSAFANENLREATGHSTTQVGNLSHNHKQGKLGFNYLQLYGLFFKILTSSFLLQTVLSCLANPKERR